MKNDYKIGLVIGVIVLLLGVGYFIFRGPGKPKKIETPSPIETTSSDSQFVGETTPTDSSGGGFNPPPPSVPEETPAATTETVEPAAVKPADSTLTERVDNWSARSGNENAVETASTDTVAPRLNATEGTAGAGETVAVKPAAATATPAADSVSEWGVPPVAPTGAAASSNTATSVEPVEATTPSTYTVQPNDVGWYIAENVYGKGMGRYWTLIRDANPKVDMSNLQKGQVLTIPPLPSAAREKMRDSATVGESFTDATGRRIYVTKSGDSLWTIAQKVYGKGYRYKEIQKANPKVDTNYLRPGLRLVIPEIPGETAAATEGNGELTTYGSETVTAVSSAQNYYTVKSGDSLWTIAEKEYGDGSYADLIKKANPRIDPNNIRVGQKIVLPPKPEGGATTTRGTSTESGSEERRTTPASPSGPVPDDEPDFGL